MGARRLRRPAAIAFAVASAGALLAATGVAGAGGDDRGQKQGGTAHHRGADTLFLNGRILEYKRGG
jgi:hypothetical protein